MTETYTVTVSLECAKVCVIDGDNGQQRRVKQSSILHNYLFTQKVFS